MSWVANILQLIHLLVHGDEHTTRLSLQGSVILSFICMVIDRSAVIFMSSIQFLWIVQGVDKMGFRTRNWGAFVGLWLFQAAPLLSRMREIGEQHGKSSTQVEWMKSTHFCENKNCHALVSQAQQEKLNHWLYIYVCECLCYRILRCNCNPTYE